MRVYGSYSLLGLVFSGVMLGQSSSVSSGIDLKAIDSSVNPCQNFYQYACGGWIKANPIPPQYSRWGRFNELQERNQTILRGILEDSAAHPDRSPSIKKSAPCMARV